MSEQANIASKTILVVANETLGGRELLDAVRERAERRHPFRPVRAAEPPRGGLVVYNDAVARCRPGPGRSRAGGHPDMGIRAIGEVGDPDPFTASMDAMGEYRPEEIIISTYPEARSGWLRRDLIDRVREATGLPVTHLVNDIDSEGLPFHVTLAVANRTASGDELLEALEAKAETFTESERRSCSSSSSRPRAGTAAAPAGSDPAEAGAGSPAGPRPLRRRAWSATRTRTRPS